MPQLVSYLVKYRLGGVNGQQRNGMSARSFLHLFHALLKIVAVRFPQGPLIGVEIYLGKTIREHPSGLKFLDPENRNYRAEDLEFCLQTSKYEILPRLNDNGVLVVR